MGNETFFKISLIALFTAFSIIRINFNLKAMKAGYQTVIEESKIYSIILALFICYEVFTLFLFLLFPETLSWGSMAIPEWGRWIGVALGILSLLLFIWVHIYLGENYSSKVRIAQEQRLVTTGPYRFLRHPMYSAFYLLHLAVFLISSNWFLGISWTLLLTLIISIRVNREERMLVEKFKEEYLAYMERTGRFFPAFRFKRKRAGS